MIRVMIVEDEEQIRNILKKMIEKTSDCEVVSSCGNFAAAISDFIKLRPDVVFMDIDLSGESGLECAKAITSWGRQYIKSSIKKAEEFGFYTIYAYTDGFYAKYQKEKK